MLDASRGLRSFIRRCMRLLGRSFAPSLLMPGFLMPGFLVLHFKLSGLLLAAQRFAALVLAKLRLRG